MTKPFRYKLLFIACLAGLMTAVHGLNAFLQLGLERFGVVPRSLEAWHHIFWAPFIHGGFVHLLNNLVGLTIFSAILSVSRSLQYYAVASLFIIIACGVLLWAFGREGVHVGASGWVFGLWGLLIAQAYFDRSLKNLLISLAIVLFYGGMIFGVLPGQRHISFEAHLFGALAGVVFAALSARLKQDTA